MVLAVLRGRECRTARHRGPAGKCDARRGPAGVLV